MQYYGKMQIWLMKKEIKYLMMKRQKIRGNKSYLPPKNWFGIGLTVCQKYEDDKWLGKNNNECELGVA